MNNNLITVDETPIPLVLAMEFSFIDNLIEDDLLTEVTVKDETLKEFSECIKEFDNIINIFIERIKAVEKVFDKMVDLFVSIDKKNLFKINNEMRNLGREAGKDLSKNAREIAKQYAVARKHFDKIANKFSVKYSAITMEMKEEYSKKLEKYNDFLYTIFDKYACDEFFERVNGNKDNAINACELNGKDVNYYYDLVGLVQSWYNYLTNEIAYTIGDIRHIYMVFGNKDNILFKILNKDYEEKLTKMKTFKMI